MFLHDLIHHFLIGLVLLRHLHQLDPTPPSYCLHQLSFLCGGTRGRFWVGIGEKGLDLLDGVGEDLAIVLELALHDLLL